MCYNLILNKLLYFMAFLYNTNQARRDAVIFGDSSDNHNLVIASFDNLEFEQLSLLIQEGFVDLTLSQNNAPTIAQFYQWAVNLLTNYPELISQLGFTGYTIGLQREDYRVSIDGCHIKNQPFELHYDIINDFHQFFKLASSFQASKKNGCKCWFD
jgi:hypothetical protein